MKTNIFEPQTAVRRHKSTSKYSKMIQLSKYEFKRLFWSKNAVFGVYEVLEWSKPRKPSISSKANRISYWLRYFLSESVNGAPRYNWKWNVFFLYTKKKHKERYTEYPFKGIPPIQFRTLFFLVKKKTKL